MLYRSMRAQSISAIAEQGSESPTRTVYDAEDAYVMTPRTTDSTGSGESESGSIPSSLDSSQSNSLSSFGNNNSVLSARSHERIAIALNSPIPQRVNRNKNQAQDREQMLSAVLRRSNSIPFLNSWEFGNIDVDLHLQFVGTSSPNLFLIFFACRYQFSLVNALPYYALHLSDIAIVV